MSERKRLNFVVDESQKERWQEHVDSSPEYDSLSEFLRMASEHELERGHPLEERRQQLPAEVHQQFRDLQNQLSELQSEVAWIRKQLHDESDLNDVAREVSQALPESHNEVMQRQQRREDKDEFVNTGTVQDLARVTDEDARVVEDAITFLRNSFVEVQETRTEAGTTHYFLKENEF
jgi:hypothetical protein